MNDQALIEGARRTGRPIHIAEAIAASIAGFHERLAKLRPPLVGGEILIHVIKPQNFFDDYCMAIVLQELCDATGCGVARVSSPAPPGLKQPASPDVEFIEAARIPRESEARP